MLQNQWRPRIGSAMRGMPMVLLVVSLFVFLLPALLWLVYQLERQQDDIQRVTDSRVTQHAIRHIAQLQRVHLRLYALIGQESSAATEAERRLQGELLLSALETVESPLYLPLWSSQTRQLIQAYRADWAELQPLFETWLFNPAGDEANRKELLEGLERAEQKLVSLTLAAHAQFEARLIDWGTTTQRLNRIVTGTILVFLFLIGLNVYLLYRFSHAQAQASEILQRSEQRHRALLDTIPDAVYRLTHDGVYLDVKPATNFTMPNKAEELIGKKLQQVFPNEIAEQVHCAIDRALATQQEQYCDYQLFSPSEALVRDYELRAVPSGLQEVQAIVRDVTVTKQQEESTRRAQKLESLGVLAGGIAHDFNNLLTGMLGQISIAKLKVGKGKSPLDNLEKAEISAERAADLTKQLLAYAGKGKFQIAPLDLNQLITDTVGIMGIGLSDHAKLNLILEDALPFIDADRGQVQQLVMNLFINAVEALGDKNGTIQIITHTQAILEENTRLHYVIDQLNDGPYVVLQVIDTGVGIEPAMLGRIFDPFFSTKGGHGLGLSATLGIIRIHHGGFHVQSQLGKGTTFTVLFSASVLPKPLPAVTPPLAALEETQQKLVLVVDDEATIREVAQEILISHGYRVLLASSGTEGLTHFHNHRAEIALILLDVRMPGMDGKQVYRAVRQLDPHIPIIFVSGYSETELNTQFDQGEEITFLPKPYTTERLIHAVQRKLFFTPAAAD
ncbi:MAG: response regulator [Caldilineaceae bacterium]|nr:response regulator [Caldilineaceae bacterium]